MDSRIIAGIRNTSLERKVACSPDGCLSVNQFLPSRAERVRLGKTWTARNTDLVTTASALPTTAAPVVLYNGNGAGGASLIIERISVFQSVVDATQSDMTCVLFQISPAGQEAAPADETNSKVSMSGKTATYNGNARLSVDVTLGTDRGWFPLGQSLPAGLTAVAGAIWKSQVFDIDGLIIIPPTAMLSLHTLKLAALDNCMSDAITFSEMVVEINQ